MDPLGHAHVPDVSRTESQLAELWRSASTEEQAVVRACALNLVVVCDEGSRDVQETTRAIAGISRSAPGRALVISRVPGRSLPGLDVFVSAHCHRGANGAQVCSEQVTLETGPDGLSLVPETVLQLLVEDMPVYVWWRRSDLEDETLPPLRDLSDWLIVNSAVFDDPARQLSRLLELISPPGWRGHATDLTWARLEPWREAVASFFDAPSMIGSLQTLTRVVVRAGGPGTSRGMTAAAAYQAGWLASRLGWHPESGTSRWLRPDGGHVEIALERDEELPAGELASVRLEATGRGSEAVFLAGREDPGSDFVRLSVDCEGTRPPAHRIQLPSRDDTALLCGLLQLSDRDAIFEAALTEAARMG